ncbi:MAG: hypothetical protein ACC742_00565 [Thermoanaerobaculales bacterium]
MSDRVDMRSGLRAKAKALEDSFFARENERLLVELREHAIQEEKRQTMRLVLELENDEILDRLMELDLAPETMIAFGLVPLVEVAWADGVIQQPEREAILKAAMERGVESDSPTCRLLESWLTTKPGPELLDTWKGYIEGLAESLSEESLDELRQRVMGRARAVAVAAGGFLGVATISKEEQAKLEELEWAFE